MSPARGMTFGLSLSVCYLIACASSVDSTLPGASVGAPPSVSGAGAQPPAAAPTPNTPAVAPNTPPATAAPQPGTAPAAPAPGVAAPAPGTAPMIDPAAMVKVTERGSCPAPDRRVSYRLPCGEVPDPCELKTDFDGDEYCWPAPKPGEGVQMHVGPTNMNDPAEVQKYIIEPGTEFLNYVSGENPMTEDAWANHVQVRMRPGSHHWIIGLVDGKVPGGFFTADGCGSSRVGGIGGGQSLIMDNPPQGVPAPEDEGFGMRMPANSSLCINLHHYNLTDHPQLREIWINVYFTDEAKVTKRGEGIGLIGGTGLSLAPGQNRTLTYSATFGADGRVRSLFGHRHMWTPRFAVWHNETLIYDSWDWMESVTFMFDSITQNPPINTDGKKDGAVSGPVNVKAGDTLRFSCFVENGSDSVLTFRNDVDTGEMCNLWGGTVGEGTGLSGTFR